MRKISKVSILKEDLNMSERPELNTALDGNTFRNYYYLKEELVDFCRKNDLPTSS